MMRHVKRAADRIGIDPYALLGVVSVLGATLFIIATYTGQIRDALNGSKPEIPVVFTDARQLREGDPVRVNGVQVGEVRKLQTADDGRATRAILSVDDKAGDLHGDASAKVAWRTVLGGAFAVNLDPGRPESGPLGEAGIPAERTSSQVELDDISTVVAGDARRGLARIPPELGDAMDDPDTLADLARTLGDVSPDVARGLNAARGRFEDRDLNRLITRTSAVARAIDAPDDGLRRLVEGAAATLGTTANRESELRRTISGAPATLRETDATLAALDETLALAEPVVDKLRAPADDVAPTLRALRPVVTGADTLLVRARPLLDSLRPAVRSLAATAREGLPLLDEIEPSLTRLDKTILPYTNEPDEQTTFTMAQMVGPGLGGLANVAAPIDANGHLLRFPFSSGSSPTYLGCQTYVNNPDKDKLIECRNLQDLIERYTNWKPLSPAPGVAPDPSERSAP